MQHALYPTRLCVIHHLVWVCSAQRELAGMLVAADAAPSHSDGGMWVWCLAAGTAVGVVARISKWHSAAAQRALLDLQGSSPAPGVVVAGVANVRTAFRAEDTLPCKVRAPL